MTGQDNGKIIDKVKKLLALTGSPYADEAEAAMLKAQELLLKHGLSISDVEIGETKEVVDEKVFTSEGKTLKWWEKTLSGIIGDNFRCAAYYRRNNPSVYFIGLKGDVEVAKEVFSYAVIVIRHLSSQYVKANKALYRDGRRLKNDYIIGFLNGLRDKFTAQVNSKCLSLMLVKDDAVIKAVDSKKFKKARRPRIGVSGDAQAIAAGYRDGMEFDYDKKMIE